MRGPTRWRNRKRGPDPPEHRCHGRCGRLAAVTVRREGRVPPLPCLREGGPVPDGRPAGPRQRDGNRSRESDPVADDIEPVGGKSRGRGRAAGCQAAECSRRPVSQRPARPHSRQVSESKVFPQRFQFFSGGVDGCEAALPSSGRPSPRRRAITMMFKSV